jgi:hypothetical protein
VPIERLRRILRAACASGLLLGAGAGGLARGGGLEAIVRDAKGDLVRDAVIVAVPIAGLPKVQGDRPKEVIDQIDKEFVPQVKVVQVGTSISFPNKDNIRHHVYSFSPAKKFELPLYRGVPAEPVLFDKPGLVILGCNIHDWMIAYLYVVESPWFATTRVDGSARLGDLPAGEYDVLAYHPRAKDPAEPLRQRASVGASTAARVSFGMTLKPPVRSSRPPKGGEADYP